MDPFQGACQCGVERYIALDHFHTAEPRAPVEPARLSAPDIHAAATSELANTGVWRTLRPVIDYERCNRCSWVCSTLCPDSAIKVSDE